MAEPIITLSENEKVIGYIETLLEKVITHALSSTKQNGNATYGDGSFVVKIFRPFLQLLKNEILAKNRINAEKTSWNEIITECNRIVDDEDVARVRFMGVLRKSLEEGHLFELFQEPLFEAIHKFTESNFYDKGGNALQNVLQALEENPPPSMLSTIGK